MQEIMGGGTVIVVKQGQSNIVSLSGFISSGKDTVADYLVEHHGFRRESFAGALKDVVAIVFGWDRELLEGKTPAARAQRDHVDKWWADKLNLPMLTPRWVLQQWGTEVCRRGFHTDIWVASMENRMLKDGGNVVVTDCRFPNEVTVMQNMGATLLRVRRGPEPTWFNIGVAAADESHPHHAQALSHITDLGIHISEWAWLSTKFDLILDNTGSLADFRQQIKDQVSVDLASI